MCAIGDTGPGGGFVFYVHSGGTFACGPTLASTCKYLEAAKVNVKGDAAVGGFYAWSYVLAEIGSNARGTAVGTGYMNTEAIDKLSSLAGPRNRKPQASTISRAYRGPNNLSDWYLPSKDELNELCKYANYQTTGNTSETCASSGKLRDGFNGFVPIYWSSTEFDASTAMIQSFGCSRSCAYGYQHPRVSPNGSKDHEAGVRPVRAF